MTFDERKRIAAELLMDFLDRFAAPRGMDDDAQAKRIEAIAESFARNMPTGADYAAQVAKVFSLVEDTHDGHSWPTQARFVSCMPRAGAQTGAKVVETYRPDDYAVWLKKRMTESLGVPEPALWGPISSSLGGSLLERYRSASVLAWRKAYKQEAYAMMLARYGTEVELYFTESR
jgi:hypothetical protein